MPVSLEIRRPPNRRARRATKAAKAIPGTTDCCPKCKSPRVHLHADHDIKFYGRQLSICTNCRTIWEPLDKALIWDPSGPSASLREPCDNCAFRPGSPEQADTAKWKELIAKLRAGGAFHCHKGVPIAPKSEDGFAYPLHFYPVAVNNRTEVSHSETNQSHECPSLQGRMNANRCREGCHARLHKRINFTASPCCS
jgi:hypothetical protein